MKKILSVVLIKFMLSSCIVMRNIEFDDTDPSKASLLPCSFDSDCPLNEFCDLDFSMCNNDRTKLVKHFDDKLFQAFNSVMKENKYEFGFRDGSGFSFSFQDISFIYGKVDVLFKSAELEILVKPLKTSNYNIPDNFIINPLFIIAPEQRKTCTEGKFRINEIYTLTSEILPKELLKIEDPLIPMGAYSEKLVFDADKDIQTICNNKNLSRRSFICNIARNGRVKVIEPKRKFLIENSKLDLKLIFETYGKNAIIKFEKEYISCISELIKESEYSDTRSTDKIAVFKVKGVLYK